jgi:hypothetical protein
LFEGADPADAETVYQPAWVGEDESDDEPAGDDDDDDYTHAVFHGI